MANQHQPHQLACMLRRIMQLHPRRTSHPHSNRSNSNSSSAPPSPLAISKTVHRHQLLLRKLTLCCPRVVTAAPPTTPTRVQAAAPHSSSKGACPPNPTHRTEAAYLLPTQHSPLPPPNLRRSPPTEPTALCPLSARLPTPTAPQPPPCPPPSQSPPLLPLALPSARMCHPACRAYKRAASPCSSPTCPLLTRTPTTEWVQQLWGCSFRLWASQLLLASSSMAVPTAAEQGAYRSNARPLVMCPTSPALRSGAS